MKYTKDYFMNIKKTMFGAILLAASLGSMVIVIAKGNEPKKSEHVIPNLTNDSFQEFVSKAKLPVIIDFYADWCQPCKRMSPVFNELAQSYADNYLFAKLDIDAASEIAKKYSINSVPTFVVLQGGEVKGTFVGGLAKDVFEQEVQQCLADKVSKKPVLKSPQMPPEIIVMQTILAGDSEELSKILKSGDIDVNKVIKIPMPYGKYAGKEIEYTLLSMALSQGNKDVVRALLDAGASTETKFKTLDGTMVTAFGSLEKTIQDAVDNKNEMKALLDNYTREKNNN
jgi:thioredoxin